MTDHTDRAELSLYDRFLEINTVDPTLYNQYQVKRGLRNDDGTGVVAGVTNISNVHGYIPPIRRAREPIRRWHHCAQAKMPRDSKSRDLFQPSAFQGNEHLQLPMEIEVENVAIFWNSSALLSVVSTCPVVCTKWRQFDDRLPCRYERRRVLSFDL
jgi:hypothetical protein